jgi:hypothetical protein
VRDLSLQAARVASLPQQSAHLDFEVMGPGGVWRSLRGYVVDAEWGAGDVDSLVTELSVTLWRAVEERSVAAFVETSPLNLDAAGEYAPLLVEGRDVRVRGCVWPAGYAASAADAEEWWRGYIWDIDDAAGESTIKLVCHDLGGRVRDKFIEAERSYGSEAGIPIAAVLRSLLDDNGLSAVPLRVIGAPGWVITTYTQAQTNVLDALQGVVATRGMSIRYLWSASHGAHVLTLYQVDRTASEPVWTFPTARIRAVSGMRRTLSNIRTAGRVRFRDKATGARMDTGVAVAPTVADPPDGFGRLYFEIVEPDDGPIDSMPEAVAERDAALADVSEPLVDLTVAVAGFPWIELGDMVTIPSDGQRFTAARTLAVVGYRHRYRKGVLTTELRLRGRPAGAFRFWIRRMVPAGETVRPRILTAAVSHSGNQATITAEGDERCLSLWAREFVAGAWGTPAQFSTTRRGTHVVTASSSAERVFEVAGRSSAELLGEWFPVAVSRFDARPPTASITPAPGQAQTRGPVSLRLTGTLGQGGVPPIAWRHRVIVGEADTAWPAFTVLGAGIATFTSDQLVGLQPVVMTRVELEVRDAQGLTTIETIGLGSSLEALSGGGRIAPGVPYDGTSRTPGQTDGDAVAGRGASDDLTGFQTAGVLSRSLREIYAAGVRTSPGSALNLRQKTGLGGQQWVEIRGAPYFSTLDLRTWDPDTSTSSGGVSVAWDASTWKNGGEIVTIPAGSQHGIMDTVTRYLYYDRTTGTAALTTVLDECLDHDRMYVQSIQPALNMAIAGGGSGSDPGVGQGGGTTLR